MCWHAQHGHPISRACTWLHWESGLKKINSTLMELFKQGICKLDWGLEKEVGGRGLGRVGGRFGEGLGKGWAGGREEASEQVTWAGWVGL